jgi:hypothetical protein
MPRPRSRRQFLGASAGSVVALGAGPLIAQSGALPSRKVTVGLTGLNRGLQVIDALEKQPGVFMTREDTEPGAATNDRKGVIP